MNPLQSAARSRRRPALLACFAIGAAGAILTVAACSGVGTKGASTTNGLPDEAGSQPAAMPSAGSALAPAGSAGAGGTGSEARGDGLTDINVSAFDRSQIKTARLGLRSIKIATVVSDIEGVATTQGGFIDSEDTATDLHGVAQSSSITLRVPVDNFDATIADLVALAQLSSKKVTTQDVTGQVADVASRVTSAKDSISQLRLLFDKATKLGDIIQLESELSGREADLEALQAQQRALTDQTSLATIAVLVTRPPATATPKPTNHKTTGFIGGLKQGWDALVTTFAAVAHALGAVLPLGLVLGLLALLAWTATRRMPALRRRRPDTSG